VISVNSANRLKEYPVWDAGVRAFHWINVLCVLGLIASGIVILNDKALGITNDGKILLKSTHVLIGYVFALNLALRLFWAFIGSPHARWREILPAGRGYGGALRRYIAAFRSGNARPYLGHNPLGRIAVTLMLALLAVQALTGLALAGTDLFYPPFGSFMAEWVAAPGVDPDLVVPYAPTLYDADAYAAMREFRGPMVKIHYYVFYALVFFASLHVVAVVVTELRGGGNLVSAMFTGRKILAPPLADAMPAGAPTETQSSEEPRRAKTG
jgi:cytochrome b